MADFIHFLRRDVRLRFPKNPSDPWYKEEQPSSGGFDQPHYHVTTDSEGAAAAVWPGDTIWLIGQLYSRWGKLPPALDARIEVVSCSPRPKTLGHKGFRYQAGPGSRWFPLADITPVLSEVSSLTKTGKVHRLLNSKDQPVGQAMRRIRRLSSAAPLRAWERTLNSRGFDFISYRLLDGTQAAFDKAQALVSDDIPVFWDRWSLPRRLAERREATAEGPLDSTIERQIRRAKTVWGIESEGYDHPGCYAARERALGQRLKKYRAVRVET